MCILVIGGAGALGSAIIEVASSHEITTVSIDVRPSKLASHSIVIKSCDEVEVIMEQLQGTAIEAVYCVAGAWTSGTILEQSLMKDCRKMWEINVEPSLLAGQLAASLDAELLVLTAAKAITHGTPAMLAYGLAKKAVVQLAKSLADDGKFKTRSICILPEVIDTPANREAMPNADMTKWTPLPVLAKYLYDLIDNEDISTGSLVTVVTRDNETSFETISDH